MTDMSPDTSMDPLGHGDVQKPSASSLSRGIAKNPWSSPVSGKRAKMTPGRSAAGPIGASPKSEDRLRTPLRAPGRLSFDDHAAGGSTSDSSLSQAPSPAATVAYPRGRVPVVASDQGTRSRITLPTIPGTVTRRTRFCVGRSRAVAGGDLEAPVRIRTGLDRGC